MVVQAQTGLSKDIELKFAEADLGKELTVDRLTEV